jgi:predicted nucleic acid-binding Zn ribbon protein
MAAPRSGERKIPVKGVARPKGDLTAVEIILSEALKRRGLDKKIARYQFVKRWQEVVGVEVARRSRPEVLSNGKLHVRVAESVWAQELSFHKTAMMRRLNSMLDREDMVDDIVFFVGKL